jgi:hypothetical protein
MAANRIYTNVSKYMDKKSVVFAVYWLMVFVVYLPAAKAGRVGDFPGWVQAVTSKRFYDYVNRTDSGIASMYQFTQVVSYLFYQLFKADAWPWHLLYITLQALNAMLLFTFFGQLFKISSVKSPALVAFAGGLLFCLCPYISEIVVWEPSFHYLLGFLLMLLVLNCTQAFAVTNKILYAWLGGFIFLLSTFSLEIFYLTPLFVLSLAVYYRTVFQNDKTVFKKVLLYFTLPQFIFFALHFSLLRIIYHQGIAHVGSVAIQFTAFNLSKSLKYVFHILFFGRFFSETSRSSFYHFCESKAVVLLFYGMLLLVAVFIAVRFRRFSTPAKAVVLLFTWSALALGLILPLWFPDTGLVIYDRYTYVLDAFLLMFVALLLNNIGNRYLFTGLIAIYAFLNYRYTHKANAYWQQSADIVNNLVATFPNDPSKKVLLLNLPECLNGVQMIGTRDDGEFRMMYNSIMPRKIKNDVYDVEAFYMRGVTDGAHVNIINDSTVRVTLNQWGTWWLYYGYGATSYENKDFKVDMRDMGHWYDVILRHPASEYLLLYVAGKDWHKVDWTKKNIDQY